VRGLQKPSAGAGVPTARANGGERPESLAYVIAVTRNGAGLGEFISPDNLEKVLEKLTKHHSLRMNSPSINVRFWG